MKSKNGYKSKYLQNRSRVMNIENKLTVSRGCGEGGDKLGDWD